MADAKNLFGKIGGILKVVAPSLASALGGPLAGLAASQICKAVGGDGAADPSGVEQQILASGDPATLQKLREADLAFEAKMREYDIDLEKVAAADRDSARAREVSVKDRMPSYLALICVLGFVAFGALVVFGPDKSRTLDTALLGAILGYFAANSQQVIAYYFGSSAGSARKTELLGNGQNGKS